MTLREIAEKWLQENGAARICNPDEGCECDIDWLVNCDVADLDKCESGDGCG